MSPTPCVSHSPLSLSLDVDKVLLNQDGRGHTFLHEAALRRSATEIHRLLSLVPAAVTSRLALTTTESFCYTAGSTFLHTAAADQPTEVAGLVLCVKELLTTEGKVIYTVYIIL